MHKKCFLYLSFTLIFASISNHLNAQEKEYPDGHGKTVKLPFGDISFADSVISYTPGKPAPIPENANPKDAIGLPDFNQDYVKGFVSLGTGGELVVQFKNNALINISGPDLYVFEMGKYVEETYLYVSKDNKKWVSVGKIQGGNALVDIGDSTKPGELFRYVKLIDAKTAVKKGDNMWPGADIDAIAAIGSAKQFSLNALYLFNTSEAILKPAAKKELDQIALELEAHPGFDIVIDGHTDSTGKKTVNEKLSKDRALAVKTYLSGKLKNNKTLITCNGYADQFPVADNKSPEGREKNRRVEIYFIPLNKQ